MPTLRIGDSTYTPKAENDLTLTLADVEADLVTAQVLDARLLSSTVLRLRLKSAAPLDYQPGQFINLVRQDGLTRSYSLASVSLRGPSGDCFYVEGRPEQPLLLCGAGTGLAPLYGIAREALRRGHVGPIALIHAARNPSGLYMLEELQELAARHSNLTYIACVIEEGEADRPATGSPQKWLTTSVQALLSERYPKLAGWRVFLCGDALLVNALRKQVFLNGASRRDIAADAFLMAAKKS